MEHKINNYNMNATESEFNKLSLEKAFDLPHRVKMNRSLGMSDHAFEKGKARFGDLDGARNAANRIKYETIEHLDKYLQEFEKNFEQNGGKVLWCSTAEQAQQHILTICQAKNARCVVKSKSMVTEEIDLNKFLGEKNIEIIETDLGEFIQQLDGEAPYHLVAPSLHKSKEDVASLFEQKLNAPAGLAPEEITLFTRQLLRRKFLEAEVGITGANFLVADKGAVVITENEGNARLSTSFPKTHIVVTGIEKIIPLLEDLSLFLPLLSTFGSGQKLTVYNSIFSGPRKADETDGPDEMYIILLDNGRTNILSDPAIRESLYCIRCGACLNGCPIYKNIGGHSYGAVYGGPIGSVIVPHLKSLEEYRHLSFASSLCGKCTEVCPVRINLHELLLENRRQSVAEGYTTRAESIGWRLWRIGSLHRWMMNIVSGRVKNYMMKVFFSKQWGRNRELPVFADKTFNRSKKKK